NTFEESDEDLLKAYRNFNINKEKELEEYNMSTDQWKQMFEVAVQTALNQQAQVFETKIRELSEQINGLRVTSPTVEEYEKISIIEGIKCDEPLDVEKSLPEFDGRQEQ
ncbi:hypothetical protein KR084_005478, partial [Drosophila pseudotakahashii]